MASAVPNTFPLVQSTGFPGKGYREGTLTTATKALNKAGAVYRHMTTDESTPTESSSKGGGEDLQAFGKVKRVMGVWDDVLADMEATAESYREEGYSVLEIHPGDVAAPEGTNGGRWGLDILVPDDEFEELERMTQHEDVSFDESEVFRGTMAGLVVLVVSMLDRDNEEAIVFPAYYDIDQSQGLLNRARETGKMPTHLRPLDVETTVTFTHQEPSLFLPPQKDVESE